jgi:hypothetical protein
MLVAPMTKGAIFMGWGISDVVVHVGRPFGSGERERLEQALSAAPGIRSVRSNPRAEQLILVGFDTGKISALGVLRCFRALGFEASLIGM